MNYEWIVKELVAAGKISQEEIDTIGSKAVTLEERQVVDMLHLVLCFEEHDEGTCTYYAESLLQNRWEKPGHLKWLDISRQIMKKFNLSVDQLSIEITECCKIVGPLNAQPGSFKACFTCAFLQNDPKFVIDYLLESSSSLS